MAARLRWHDRDMTRLQWFGLGALVAQQLATLLLVPESPLHALGEPTYLAALAATATTIFLLISRFVARRGDLERLVLAVFLAGMPMVYLWAALLRGDRGALAVELAGVAIFGGAAIAGYLRVPWLLGVGILAHGVLWDAWHHGRSGYIADWYSAACLIADLGIGIYALTHVRRLAPRVAIANTAYG
jgi:hypothetical protein